MRIRMDLPIDKPLRRGENIVNSEGDNYWVTFKYERFPNFCFLCGILGHEWNCFSSPSNTKAHRQYGDWLRANGCSKRGIENPRASSSGGLEERKDKDSDDWKTSTTSNSMDVEAKQVGFPTTLTSCTWPKNTKLRQEGTSIMQLAKNQAKDDKVSLLSLVPQSNKHSRDPPNTYRSKKGSRG